MSDTVIYKYQCQDAYSVILVFINTSVMVRSVILVFINTIVMMHDAYSVILVFINTSMTHTHEHLDTGIYKYQYDTQS